MRRALPVSALVVLVNDLALAALLAPAWRVPALVGLAGLGVAAAVWVPVAMRTEHAVAPERHDLAADLDALDGRVATLEGRLAEGGEEGGGERGEENGEGRNGAGGSGSDGAGDPAA